MLPSGRASSSDYILHESCCCSNLFYFNDYIFISNILCDSFLWPLILASSYNTVYSFEDIMLILNS